MERQVLHSSWISVNHVARPGLLDAVSIGGTAGCDPGRWGAAGSGRAERPQCHSAIFRRGKTWGIGLPGACRDGRVP
jgi:hypothetical protein